MELIVVAVLTLATLLTGVVVTDPQRGTWHPAPSEREATRWRTGWRSRPRRRRDELPVRHRRQAVRHRRQGVHPR